MSRRKVLVGIGLWVTLLGLGVWGGLLAAQRAQSRSPESLLPAESVFYLRWDGIDAHRAAWERTGMYGALFETTLGEFFSDSFTKLAARAQGPEGPDPDGMLEKYALPALEHIAHHGVTASLSIRSVEPFEGEGTTVIHGAGRGETRELFVSMFDMIFREGTMQFDEFRRDGRTITQGIDPDGEHVTWWSEGNDLVISIGNNSKEVVLQVAAGERPSLETNPALARYAQVEGFEKTLTAWIDGTRLWNLLGEVPGEDGLKASRVLRALGLNRLEGAAYQWGFHGKQLRSAIRVDAPAPRTGLLALLDQEPFSFEDLPPLPTDPRMLYACSIDWSKAYDTIVSTVVEVAEIVEPESVAELQANLAQLPAMLGFDPKQDLLSTLGSVAAFYMEPAQPLPIINLQIGAALAVQVKDAARLRQTLEGLFARLEQMSGGELTVASRKVAGADVHYFQVAQVGGMFVPTLAVTDAWFTVGLSPQIVEGFARRAAGKEPVWKPTPEWLAVRDGLPERGVGFSFGDARPGIKETLALAPMGAAMARQLLGVELDLTKVPPADEVTAHLFPNVSVMTVDDDGFRSVAHSALPLSGNEGIGTGGVGVALLLPAVQAARAASRKATSSNNQRQQVLAILLYADTSNGQTPAGTYPNPALPPEKRLSWIARVLPYVEEDAVYDRIDFKKSWEDPANREAASTEIDVFLNPAMPVEDVNGYAPTHYVGMAGLGENAAMLPANDPKAGLFGYDRTYAIDNIPDGSSNTIAIIEVSKDLGPWAAGGAGTVRGFTKKPYLNGPDGFGGWHRGGVNVGFADGSVRFMREGVDQRVLEAMATANGGEPIGF